MWIVNSRLNKMPMNMRYWETGNEKRSDTATFNSQREISFILSFSSCHWTKEHRTRKQIAFSVQFVQFESIFIQFHNKKKDVEFYSNFKLIYFIWSWCSFHLKISTSTRWMANVCMCVFVSVWQCDNKNRTFNVQIYD